MSVVSRELLKSYFQTEDTPTEAEFINVFDSLVHQSEGVKLNGNNLLGSTALEIRKGAGTEDDTIFMLDEDGQFVMGDFTSGHVGFINIGGLSMLRLAFQYGEDENEIMGFQALSSEEIGNIVAMRITDADMNTSSISLSSDIVYAFHEPDGNPLLQAGFVIDGEGISFGINGEHTLNVGDKFIVRNDDNSVYICNDEADAKLSFFGVGATTQQEVDLLPTATATGEWGVTERNMLQAVYDKMNESIQANYDYGFYKSST